MTIYIKQQQIKIYGNSTSLPGIVIFFGRTDIRKRKLIYKYYKYMEILGSLAGFKNRVKHIISANVPDKARRLQNKPMWMSGKLLKEIRHKR
jgi:hypothetical protein